MSRGSGNHLKKFTDFTKHIAKKKNMKYRDAMKVMKKYLEKSQKKHKSDKNTDAVVADARKMFDAEH